MSPGQRSNPETNREKEAEHKHNFHFRFLFVKNIEHLTLFFFHFSDMKLSFKFVS